MSEKINAEYTKTEFSTLTNDVTGDYILPDSYPDVKSVLSATARISELRKYFGPSDAEINGCVVYNIVFTTAGEDDTDVICSVSFNEDFKENLKYKFESNSGVGTQTSIADVSCRMANPRKFSLKSVLKTIMFEDIVCSAYPKLPLDAPADADMQYKTEICEILGCTSITLAEHSFSDNIEIDMKLPEIEKIVNWDAALNIRDERNGDIKNTQFKLGGVLTLCIIYTDKDGKYHCVNKDTPFNISLNEEESAMLSGGESNIIAVIPSVYITALNLNAGKNQYDEAKVIEFDADYDIDLLLFASRNIEYVIDAYSTKYDCDCKCEKEVFRLSSGHICNNFTNSDSEEKRELGIENMDVIMSFSPRPIEIHIDKTENYSSLSGKLDVRAVAADRESGTVKGKDIFTNFSYRANMPTDGQIFGNTFAMNGKLRSDNEKVYSDAEVYVDYVVSENKAKSVCTSTVTLKAVSEDSKPVFSVYYPSRSDTLWDTAKKKKTTLDSLKNLNPEAEIVRGLPLIIE